MLHKNNIIADVVVVDVIFIRSTGMIITYGSYSLYLKHSTTDAFHFFCDPPPAVFVF